MLALDAIRTICTGRIAISEPLAPLTSFRIGGPADLLIEPAGIGEAHELVRHLRSQSTPFTVIGNGSNVLVSDAGFRGVVIHLGPGFSTAGLADGVVTAGAGMRLAAFVDFCVTRGLAGVEMLAGIPGTLGGALVMNAGAHGGEIGDTVVDVTVLRGGDLMTLRRDACGFVYRDSALRGDIVLSARFAPGTGDVEALTARRRELIARRNATQPLTRPNAGSIFRNPEGTFAGRLIEDAGLKGARIGGAEVAGLHANFISNVDDATAADVVALINHVRERVCAHSGILLEPEIRFIGFPTDPVTPIHQCHKAAQA